MKTYLSIFCVLLISTQVSGQEKLWKDSFEGWTFGYKSDITDRDTFWEILPDGILRAEGGGVFREQSGMQSYSKYGNYRLTLEYRWMTTFNGGNSGIWIHGQDEGWAADNGAYPISIEVQLRKNHAGDLLRKGLEIDEEPGFPSQGEAVWRRNEDQIVEHHDGTWNKMMIECRSNTISVWLNDLFINRAVNVRTQSGESVDFGYITLQSELRTIDFRNLYVEPLDPSQSQFFFVKDLVNENFLRPASDDLAISMSDDNKIETWSLWHKIDTGDGSYYLMNKEINFLLRSRDGKVNFGQPTTANIFGFQWNISPFSDISHEILNNGLWLSRSENSTVIISDVSSSATEWQLLQSAVVDENFTNEFKIVEVVLSTQDETIRPQLLTNPVGNRINLLNVEPNTWIRIGDVSGKVLIETSFHEEVDISRLSQGSYLLYVGSDTLRFIKE